MRKLVPLTAVVIVLGFAGNGWGQQSVPASASAATPTQTSTSAPASQDPLAEAARKAREQKKEEHKPPRVFTNDDLPTSGGISTVGQAPAPTPTPAPAASGSATPAGQKPGTPAASSMSDEAKWREKFATLRHKIEQDQQNLDLLQRELGVLNTQFYGDPNKQLQQQLTRSDIDAKTAEIDKAKDQLATDQKALDDAQDDLRASGGNPGWGR
jgi:hypothetical protein